MGLVSFETNVSKTAGQIHEIELVYRDDLSLYWAIMCDVRGINAFTSETFKTQSLSENQMHLKRATQGAFCVSNANAKSQTRKSIKINVICNTWMCASYIVLMVWTATQTCIYCYANSHTFFCIFIKYIWPFASMGYTQITSTIINKSFNTWIKMVAEIILCIYPLFAWFLNNIPLQTYCLIASYTIKHSCLPES